MECEKLIERQRKLLEDKSSEKYSLQNKLKQMHDRERRMHNEIEGTRYSYYFERKYHKHRGGFGRGREGRTLLSQEFAPLPTQRVPPLYYFDIFIFGDGL